MDIMDNKKKVCACGQAKRCSNLQEQLAKLKYNIIVGYLRVQTKYNTAHLGKVAERHRRICAHLKLVPIKTNKATANDARVNIAYHHFDYDMLVKHGGIVDTINLEESREIGYVDNADRCSENKDRFWFCPTMSNEKIDDLLFKLGIIVTLCTSVCF